MNLGKPDIPDHDDSDATVVDPSLAADSMPSPHEDQQSTMTKDSDSAEAHYPPVDAELDSQQTVITQRPLGYDSSHVYRATSPAEIGATLVGKKLGHFELEKFIGGGGMGAVFKAQDTMLGRTVAVKVLSRDQSGDDDTLRRFKNEAQSAARLDHANIARVHYVGVDDGWNFIVFEYIDGDNLREVVEQGGPLAIEDAILFTLQVAEALDHAALRDVVHRDIKPSNVLITPEGRAKLVDMGLARLHQVEAGESDITASGVTLGTFDYISPEQARDPRLADVRSDLYSLGCTLFFMLTGKPPFPEGTVLQKLLSHSSEAPPDPREFRAGLPDEITAIVHKLLEKKPESRYQNAGELIRDLSLLANQFGIEEAVSPSGRPINVRQFQWLDKIVPWAAPLAILFVFVGGLELYSNWNQPVDQLPTLAFPSDAPSQGPPLAPEFDAIGEPGTDDSTIDDSPDGDQPVIDPPASDDGEVSTALPGPQPADTPSTSTAASNTSPQSETTDAVPREPAPTESNDDGMISPAEGDTPSAKESVVAPRTLVIGAASLQAELENDQVWASSLSAAFADSKILPLLKNLDTIELKYDGYRDEQPIRFPANLDLVIRGAEGKRPGLRFRPEWDGKDLPSPSMLELHGGNFELRDVAIEMRLPDARLYDRWSLFEARAQDRLKLTRCVISIDNSRADGSIRHPDAVAVFEVLSIPDETAIMNVPMPLGDSADATEVLPIKIDDCVIRGDAMLVRATEAVPINLRWDNGLLVTRQSMLSVGGTQKGVYDDEAHIHIGLRRVTAIVPDGLAVFNDSSQQPYQLPVELVCDQCVFVSHRGSSMVEHQGVMALQRYSSLLKVEGGGNFFQDVDVFWEVLAADGENQFDWQYWQQRWGAGGMPSFVTDVSWVQDQNEVSMIAPQSRRPADYLLDPSAENRAYHSEAGFNSAALPAVPFADQSTAVPPRRPDLDAVLRPTTGEDDPPPQFSPE